ncbi:MAG: alpha-amylase family glycosyl hydrolase [Sandaracinaceae bacterium]
MQTPEVARGDGRDVMLQAFHWNLVKTQGTGTVDGQDRSWYRILREDFVDRIAALDVSLVLLPPPWVDDSAWEEGGRHGGGEGYFWRDFDLDSRYGTKAELIDLVAALRARGIRCIADLVVNHRDAHRMRQDVWPYPGPHWRLGGEDSGAGFLDGRFDLNLNHPDVRARILRAMNELLDEVGVVGWRWDFVWGYRPEEVVAAIRATPAREYFSFGEYWQGMPDKPDDPFIARYGREERDRIIGWALDTGCCALDIPTKGAIQSGDPRWLGAGLHADPDPEVRGLAVTYVDNHDTGASPHSPSSGWGQKHWECPPHFKSMAYAYVLSMPGVPTVYWPDAFDWGFEERLRGLIAARRRAGVTARSAWRDLRPPHEGFAAVVADERGEESLALSIGSDYPGPGRGWEAAAEHPGQWTVWVRAR